MNPKGGARKVTLLCSSWGFLVNGDDLVLLFLDDCSQAIFEVKSALTFPFVYTLLYIVSI